MYRRARPFVQGSLLFPGVCLSGWLDHPRRAVDHKRTTARAYLQPARQHRAGFLHDGVWQHTLQRLSAVYARSTKLARTAAAGRGAGPTSDGQAARLVRRNHSGFRQFQRRIGTAAIGLTGCAPTRLGQGERVVGLFQPRCTPYAFGSSAAVSRRRMASGLGQFSGAGERAAIPKQVRGDGRSGSLPVIAA